MSSKYFKVRRLVISFVLALSGVFIFVLPTFAVSGSWSYSNGMLSGWWQLNQADIDAANGLTNGNNISCDPNSAQHSNAFVSVADTNYNWLTGGLWNTLEPLDTNVHYFNLDASSYVNQGGTYSNIRIDTGNTYTFCGAAFSLGVNLASQTWPINYDTSINPLIVTSAVVTPNPAQVNSSITATTTASDFEGGGHTATANWGDGINTAAPCTVNDQTWPVDPLYAYPAGSGFTPATITCSLPSGYSAANVYPVTITVYNTYTSLQRTTGITNVTVAQPNTSPNVGAVSVSPNPAQINTSINATASFTDPDAGQSHTATIDWGDGTGPHTCTVTEATQSVSCSLPTGYSSANIYSITITVSDGTDSGNSPVAYASVYNPTQGSVFSAGSKYTSPAGAYVADTSLTGNVTFGLNYKYSGTMPQGLRSFSMDFNAANFHFNASTVNTLIIANSFAVIKGSGTVTGSSQTYTYLVTGDGVENTVRIQIKDQSGTVVYDTQPGATDNAEPTLVVNNVVVH